MIDKENRAIAHRILDLLLDINGNTVEAILVGGVIGASINAREKECYIGDCSGVNVTKYAAETLGQKLKEMEKDLEKIKEEMKCEKH